jgi:hypothetical protein
MLRMWVQAETLYVWRDDIRWWALFNVPTGTPPAATNLVSVYRVRRQATGCFMFLCTMQM